MIDIDLLVSTLKQHGHTVESAISIPENAGGYELSVDGYVIPILEAERLLEREDAEKERTRQIH
jgi:hypothetical protein